MSEAAIVPCRQLQTFAQAHYYISYYSTSYSCGSWWYSNTCYRSNARTSSYNTYYTQEVCCPGYGGDMCEPICNIPCGANHECSAPQTCTCEDGWKGANCQIDINECEEGTDECQYHESCINIAGTYNCNCPLSGDKLGLDGLNCIKPVTVFHGTPGRRYMDLYWNHPVNDVVNGSYEIDCVAENASISFVSYFVDWVEEFRVEPVTPFTDYICSIKPVTENGIGNPTDTEIKTLQDKPDGPPMNLKVHAIDSMIMQIDWMPPEIPNGIIEYYKMYVNFTNSTKLRKLRVDPEFTNFFLEFLNPYQLIGISLSAVTNGGEGPVSSFVFNRTKEAEPGRIHDIQVSINSENSVTLTWNPPVSLNGVVLSYHVSLYRLSKERRDSVQMWELEADEELSTMIHNLEPYVPYEFIVIAATKVGRGEFTPHKYFTAENAPKVSPLVSRSRRASATQVFMQWSPLSDDELRGFFTNYVVRYYTTAVNSDCSSPMDGQTVSTTDEYITLSNLDSHSAYCVQVAAATSAGPGNFTELLYIDMYESTKFELHLNGVHDCKNYVLDENRKKLRNIAEELTDVCNQYCKCGVQDDHIGDLRFQCDDANNTKVICQGSIVGTPGYWSYDLVENLEQWKNSSPIIVVEGLQLRVDRECSIVLEDFGTHARCNTPPPTIQQLTNTDTENKNQPAIIATIFSMVVFALIALIAIVVIIIILVRVRHLKQARQMDTVRYDVNHPSATNPNTTYEDTYKASLEQTYAQLYEDTESHSSIRTETTTD